VTPRIDHVAVEADDPERVAEFYERVVGARVRRPDQASGVA